MAVEPANGIHGTLAGEYADRVYWADHERNYYFARSGERVPVPRAIYTLGTVIGTVLVVGAIVLTFVRLFIRGWWWPGFDDDLLVLKLPAVLLILLAIVSPFMRRRFSTDGQLVEMVSTGEVLLVPDSDLARDVAAAALDDRPGYFECAAEIARASDQRKQVENMTALAAATPVTGRNADEIRAELHDRCASLLEAIDAREAVVRQYLSGVNHGA